MGSAGKSPPLKVEEPKIFARQLNLRTVLCSYKRFEAEIDKEKLDKSMSLHMS
jgi:hypothetical protein